MTDGLPLETPGSAAAAALARIDAALSRIEQAAARPPAPANNSALEETVRGSLAELDTLIARMER